MTEAMPIHKVSGSTGDRRNLLLLDIDGALHPVGADYSFSSKFFSHLPLLEELLREFTSVDNGNSQCEQERKCHASPMGRNPERAASGLVGLERYQQHVRRHLEAATC
jgi:hypothetical protein